MGKVGKSEINELILAENRRYCIFVQWLFEQTYKKSSEDIGVKFYEVVI